VSYCTAYDVTISLDIQSIENDPFLERLCTAAGAWIDAHCGVPGGGFAATTSGVRYFDTRSLHGGTLTLSDPLLSLTSITNADGTTLAPANCRLYPLGGPRYWSIRPLSGYAWSIVTDGLYIVTGVWGWSSAAPAPVKEAAIMLAGWMFKRYQAALQDNAASPDLGQLVYGEAIPRQVLALLAPFRNGMEML